MVSQEEHVDVNFIKNNNFNNNAYRNNFGNNNYRPYPAGSNGYSHNNSGILSDERMVEIEKATKNFMQSQYEQNQVFTKTMNEQTAMLKNIMHQLENLNGEIFGLQTKISIAENRISSMSGAQSSLINRMAAKPEALDDKTFATANAIQVKIDNKLHARWEREDKIAEKIV